MKEVICVKDNHIVTKALVSCVHLRKDKGDVAIGNGNVVDADDDRSWHERKMGDFATLA